MGGFFSREPPSEAGCSSELFRPSYHFTPPSGWMNDPNGLIYHAGEYHLFYQHFPRGTTWGPMHWGHAVSRDLLHWHDLPIALAPDKLGFIFSGSVVHDGSQLVAIFTHHGDSQVQSLAFSADRGRTWSKYAANPVLASAVFRDFRDPKVIWHAPTKSWVMTLAAGDRILFYGSSNLKQWRPLSEFGAGGDGAHGEGRTWECPDLFPLTHDGVTHWVLIVSVNGDGGPNGGSGTQYFLGRFNGTHFINANARTTVKWLDYGRDNYAAVTYSGRLPGDRVVAQGWLTNWIYANEVPTEGWRSGMTLPRSLHLVSAGHHGLVLASRPVAEVESLRVGSSHRLQPRHLPLLPGLAGPDHTQALKSLPPAHRIGLTGLHDAMRFELQLTISSLTGWFGLELSNGAHRHGASESYRIGIDGQRLQVFSDRRQSRSSASTFCCNEGRSECDCFFREANAPYHRSGSGDGFIELRVFVDASSVELFVDGGVLVMSESFFPTRRFDRAAIVGHGFRLEAGRLHNLRSVTNRSECAWEALRLADDDAMPEVSRARRRRRREV